MVCHWASSEGKSNDGRGRLTCRHAWDWQSLGTLRLLTWVKEKWMGYTGYTESSQISWVNYWRILNSVQRGTSLILVAKHENTFETHYYQFLPKPSKTGCLQDAPTRVGWTTDRHLWSGLGWRANREANLTERMKRKDMKRYFESMWKHRLRSWLQAPRPNWLKLLIPSPVTQSNQNSGKSYSHSFVSQIQYMWPNYDISVTNLDFPEIRRYNLTRIYSCWSDSTPKDWSLSIAIKSQYH